MATTATTADSTKPGARLRPAATPARTRVSVMLRSVMRTRSCAGQQDEVAPQALRVHLPNRTRVYPRSEYKDCQSRKRPTSVVERGQGCGYVSERRHQPHGVSTYVCP